MKDQDEVLDRAARYVRPGGRIAYVTCSLLCEENEDRVAAFLARALDFVAIPAAAAIAAAGLPALAPFARDGAVRLTPRQTSTDGFFISLLSRKG